MLVFFLPDFARDACVDEFIDLILSDITIMSAIWRPMVIIYRQYIRK